MMKKSFQNFAIQVFLTIFANIMTIKTKCYV